MAAIVWTANTVVHHFGVHKGTMVQEVAESSCPISEIKPDAFNMHTRGERNVNNQLGIVFVALNKL